jgi:E3 ubiquitin-protein ligase RBX1
VGRHNTPAMTDPEPPLAQLRKWCPVAVWTYRIDNQDQCPICLSALEDVCIECRVDAAAKDACVQALGACNHAYHAHCINKYLRSKEGDGALPACPLCRLPWELQRVVVRP